MRKFAFIIPLIVIAAVAGCTTEKTPAPPMTGPSEFALRLSLQSVPDSILQDGASQSAINIEATGADSRPVRGLGLRIETQVGGVMQDFGTLSARSVVTGEDGRARVTYTAPPQSGQSASGETVVTFFVTPIGTDYRGEQARSVDLRLVPPGVILPPNNAPNAAFTFSPTAPGVLQDVVFDATATTDGTSADGSPISCGAACTYQWDFGDGGTASGVFVSHRFQRIGLYLVKLTVTDQGRATTTVTQAVNVGQGVAPTAAFTFSPAAPAINQDIFFNAGGSTATPGRRIVDWDWDFGSGRTGTGQTIVKQYGTAGTYTVSLTVTDDAGTQARTTQDVTVGGAGTGPQPVLTISPTAGTPATVFFIDARASSGPSPITHYRFTFGDGTPDQEGTTATASHQYATPGTYVVRLTVRDSAGRTATTTQNLTINTP
jgi:PKD repeat protein